MKATLLRDRTVIRIAGDDARTFLQGLVTCNVALATTDFAVYGAMLTPQGKILSDFFVIEGDGALLIDAPQTQARTLVERLRFYRLRSKISITDIGSDNASQPGETCDGLAVAALFHSPDAAPKTPKDAIIFRDPRANTLGFRVLVRQSQLADFLNARNLADDYWQAYEELRISVVAPKGGVDFAYGETFPHDANMDLLNGVSFDKGCYVGQEVVSRMRHKGAIRKRIVLVSFKGPPPASGAAILAADTPIGAMGSSAGERGLAALRLDRLADAQADRKPLLADGVALHVAMETAV